MRKISSYLYIFAVLGVIVLVAGLALGGHSVNQVMSKAGSGIAADSSTSASNTSTSAGHTGSIGGPAAAAAATPTTAMAVAPTAVVNSTLSLDSGRAVGATTMSGTMEDGFSYAPSGTGKGGSTSGGPPMAYNGVGSAATAPHDSVGMDVAEATAVAPLPADQPADQQPQQQGDNQNPLRASEVDDNADYNAFIGYLQSKAGVAGNIAPDLSERYFVQVQNGQQRPVADALVKISSNGQSLFTGRTGSDGRVVFFPHAVQGSVGVQSFDVTVSRDQASAKATLSRIDKSNGAVVTLNTAPDSGVNLDVVFLIDSTGSMDDEIAKIKQSLHSVVSRISELPSQPRLRLGLVTYRDRGADNEYVTRKWDFTSDVNTFQQELDTLVAYNGDDYPEDINAGLSDALNLPGWSQTNGHDLRLVFLVGDAPPHLDYTDEQQYPTLSAQAAAQGVKIFPIAASGLDNQGEFIFRQMAAITLGKFVFLTYAPAPNGGPSNGGNPGDTSTMHVSGYQTNNFDDVVVNLVSEEVANQRGPKAQTGSGANVTTLANPDDMMPTPPALSEGDSFDWVRWGLALGWLPLLAIGLFAYRRNRPAALGPLQVRPARHEPLADGEWATLKADGAKAEVESVATYIRPARYWATAVGEMPTSRMRE